MLVLSVVLLTVLAAPLSDVVAVSVAACCSFVGASLAVPQLRVLGRELVLPALVIGSLLAVVDLVLRPPRHASLHSDLHWALSHLSQLGLMFGVAGVLLVAVLAFAPSLHPRDMRFDASFVVQLVGAAFLALAAVLTLRATISTDDQALLLRTQLRRLQAREAATAACVAATPAHGTRLEWVALRRCLVSAR
jgi:hypothetical protein